MKSILVTGANGFLASHLIERLALDHDVVVLSRSDVTSNAGAVVKGSFASPEVLQCLDKYVIDTVIHLAAVTGGCTEEIGLETNVCGTRTLLRYLADRGCTRYILASSVAAVGSLSPNFLPRELPISDDHPCDTTDAYGLSKALMEEIAFYFSRLYPEFEFTLFRIGSVLPHGADAVRLEMLEGMHFPFVDLAAVALDDVLGAISIAASRPVSPGIRRANLVSRWARTPIGVPETLKALLGGRVAELDLSYYQGQRAGASLYAVDRLSDVFGFVPSIDVRTMTAPGAAEWETGT